MTPSQMNSKQSKTLEKVFEFLKSDHFKLDFNTHYQPATTLSTETKILAKQMTPAIFHAICGISLQS